MPLIPMLWFYSRNRDSLQIETRYDNETLEYVGILTYPDGRRETKRFRALADYRAWLIEVERELVTERWIPTGAPQILPDGWPDTRPLR